MDSDQADIDLLRRAFAVAAMARENGNHPFGAVLAGPNNEILLEAENSVETENNITAHAERSNTILYRMVDPQSYVHKEPFILQWAMQVTPE